MGAGVADFIIEQGADWTSQIYWVTEQTSEAIFARGPMSMDIVSPLTGQLLIRLDDGANGGIDTGGAPWGIIQLGIDHNTTLQFATGRYIYDLFCFSQGLATAPAGPAPQPLQRIRLLTGNVIVERRVTDVGVQFAQMPGASVLPPDIILYVHLDTSVTPNHVVFTFDPLEPANFLKTPQTGRPIRARLIAQPGVTLGNFPSNATVWFTNDQNQSGQVTDSLNDPIQAITIQSLMANNSVLTVIYNPQTHGLAVTRAETNIFP